MAAKWRPARILSCAQQWELLRRRSFPEFTGTIGPHGWTASFLLRPTADSRAYRVQVEFTRSSRPSVRILAPNLLALSCARIPPHLYPPIEHPLRLCLFHPHRGEWTRAMSIADSMVPWAAEWLMHFELWLVTDEWRAGGEHPQPRDDREEHYADRLQNRWRLQRLAST